MRDWEALPDGEIVPAEAIDHLRGDAVMAALVDRLPPPRPRRVVSLFEDLVDSVVSQQLSVTAADAIMARLAALFPDNRPTPAGFALLADEELRAAGLSRAKVRALREIGAAFADGSVDPARIVHLPDEEFIDEISRLRGVGRWTAQMLLIFSLGRRDVFAMGDLGLRTAVARHYGVERDDREAIERISAAWSPWRSVACRYLWLSLDNTPALDG